MLCHEFPPVGGGCGRNLYSLCCELWRRGLRFEIWTAATPAGVSAPEFPFPVLRFDLGRRAMFETNSLRLLRYAAAVQIQCRRVRHPPAAVFSAMAFPAGWAGVRLSRRWDVPHWVWYHGSDVHGGKANGPNGPIRWYLRWLFRGTQGNFFVSQDLLTMAEKAGRPPHPRILPPCPAEEMASRFPAAAPSAPYFLWAGRLEPVKAPLLFVQSVAILKNLTSPPPRVRMAGDGSLRRSVLRVSSPLADVLALEPPLAADLMVEALGGAYAVVLTSRIEGFSTLLLEAARFGVPAVAGDVPGVREFVGHESNGILVRPGDPGALAHAMLRLWIDPDLRRRLGDQARRDAAAFTPARNAECALEAWRAFGVSGMPVAAGAAA